MLSPLFADSWKIGEAVSVREQITGRSHYQVLSRVWRQYCQMECCLIWLSRKIVIAEQGTALLLITNIFIKLNLLGEKK